MAPAPYLLFPGTARQAMSFYAEVFGGRAELHTFAEFGGTDGPPPEAIAHGVLVDAPLSLYAADAAGDEKPLRLEGILLSLLGTAEPETLRRWFSRLADGGTVVDDLQAREWNASDGRVVDRFGVPWLIGFEH